MFRRLLLALAIGLAATLPALAQTQTTEVAGVKYDNSLALAGSTLQLNGAGVRYKLVIKVYTAGLRAPSGWASCSRRRRT